MSITGGIIIGGAIVGNMVGHVGRSTGCSLSPPQAPHHFRQPNHRAGGRASGHAQGVYHRPRPVNIETVNLTGFGDVHLAGDRTLFTERLEFMLPVQTYPFNDPTHGA